MFFCIISLSSCYISLITQFGGLAKGDFQLSVASLTCLKVYDGTSMNLIYCIAINPIRRVIFKNILSIT